MVDLNGFGLFMFRINAFDISCVEYLQEKESCVFGRMVEVDGKIVWSMKQGCRSAGLDESMGEFEDNASYVGWCSCSVMVAPYACGA
jgi:hypothetical protein